MRLDGEQNRAHDASIGVGVLPARAAVDVQSGSEGGFRSRALLQVDSVQTRRGFGPCQGLFQARRFPRSLRLRAPSLSDQTHLHLHRSPSRLALSGFQL